MKLAAYLEETGELPAQFAKRLGRSPSTITRIIPNAEGKRLRYPSFELIEQIATVTGGRVKANDFMRVD